MMTMDSGAVDSASLAPPNNASVAAAMTQHAPASAAPNEASILAIRNMMKCEPALAIKWSSPQNESLNVSADTVQFDENGNVVFLNLGGMRLRSLPANAFASLDKLQTLNLGGTDLPLAQLETVLSNLVAIESLLLGGNSLGPKGAAMVANTVVPTKSTLQHLDLRFNEIGDEGVTALANTLAKNTSIKFLYLEGNQITQVGCSALAKALLENSTVEELYLGANDIGPDGAASLAEVISTNTTLRKLFVDGNQLGPQGANAFSEALERLDGKATLTQLYADNNNLGKEAAKRLAKALNSNTVVDDCLFGG
jgi:Ran GTPase-activating protein (RanGAP) involved in mRNA processing and transport